MNGDRVRVVILLTKFLLRNYPATHPTTSDNYPRPRRRAGEQASRSRVQDIAAACPKNDHCINGRGGFAQFFLPFSSMITISEFLFPNTHDFKIITDLEIASKGFLVLPPTLVRSLVPFRLSLSLS